MEEPKEKVYVLKPYKASAKKKASKLVPVSNDLFDVPAPEVVFQGRSFCFTGVFDCFNGDRNQCEAAISARGGFCFERPNHALNYLVVGKYNEPAWKHGVFGRKILTVYEFKNAGASCKIISEDHWFQFLNNTPELSPGQNNKPQHASRNKQLVQLQSDLEKLMKNHQLLVNTLKNELNPETYNQISERLKQLGVII